jgi:hypothetical protein
MRKRKFKALLILFALLVVGIVAFFYPEHAEAVARALMLIIGVI